MGLKRLEKALNTGFRWYGELVGRRPLPFLLVPLVLTFMVGPGLLWMLHNDDVIMLFTPYNAPSRHEQRISREFSSIAVSNNSRQLPMTSDRPTSEVWFNTQVSSEQNVMTADVWGLIADYVDFIYQNFTCTVDDWPSSGAGGDRSQWTSSGPRTIRYNPQLCDAARGCLQLDKLVRQVYHILNNTEGFGADDRVRLTYPVMYVWGRPFNWGHYIHGVDYNTTDGRLLSARIVSLYFAFQLDLDDPRVTAGVTKCISEMTRWTLNWHRRTLAERNVSFSPVSEAFISEEVSHTKDYLAPYLSATIVIIILFIFVSSFRRHFVLGGLLLALMGVLTVGMSLLAGFGLMSLCGISLNFVVLITPFLVLCVGIDNDFLLTSSWSQSDPRQPVWRRFGWTLQECGSNLFLTNINDTICFAFGILSETPAVSDFCMYTCIALLIRFLYQMTFFCAVLVYAGRAEDDGQPATDWRRLLTFGLTSKSASGVGVGVGGIGGGSLKKQTPIGLIGQVNYHLRRLPLPSSSEQRCHAFFRDRFASWLMLRPVRVAAGCCYLIYIVAAVYGAASWRIDISPRKLFSDYSPLQQTFRNLEQYIFKRSISARVFVSSPPDFRRQDEVDRFLQFVADLEAVQRDFVPESRTVSDLWLRQYSEFYQFLASGPGETFRPDFFDYISDFLSSSDYMVYANDLRFRAKNGSAVLDKFQFSLLYYLPPDSGYSYDDHVQTLLNWRTVCANYSDYDALVYDLTHMNAYLDQRLTLAATCLETMGFALASITVVTALMMPNVRSMFFICLSFLSVDIGVIAGLNLWYSDLDPTSSAFLLQTVGFCVYYTARVCFSFETADKRLDSEQKLRQTMAAVGWPIVQGAAATSLGVLPVVFGIPSYMIRVFYRTMFLVVGIGLLHGLLFIPCMLVAFNDNNALLNNQLRSGRSKSDKKHGYESDDQNSMSYSSNCSSGDNTNISN